MKNLINTLFEHSLEAIYIIHDNQFIDCNKAAVNLFGYSNKSFLLNCSPAQVSPKFQHDGQSSYDKAESLMQKVLRGEAQRFEWTLVKADGSEFMVEVALSKVIWEEQIVLLALFHDITQKKNVQEAIFNANQELASRETLLKQILDTSSVAIFLVDRQGYIVHANQRMADMFALPLESLVGKEYVELINPLEQEIGRQKMLALLHSEVHFVSVERSYWRADGHEFWGHLTGKRFYSVDGKELGLVGVIADITKRRNVEGKLKLIASVFTHAREGISIADAQGIIYRCK